MRNGMQASFEEAREREGDLNERQRRILDLIERGHTNREIADVLGISIDGAKWNVSEILTKLGLSSREEAADYWRWRQGWAQPLRRLLRAIGGIPGLKWAVASGGAALVTCAAAYAVFAGAGNAAPALTPPDSFYLEASAHYADPEHPADYIFRWWHYDVGHAKWDWDKVSPAIETHHESNVLDGSTLYTYSPDGRTLRIDTAFANGTELPRPKDVVLVGPIEQDSLQDLLTWLSSWGDGKTTAQVTGYERIDSRDTAVISYVAGTMWVDTSEMIIVKNLSDGWTIELAALSRAPFSRDLVTLPRSAAVLPTPTPVDFPNPRVPIPAIDAALRPTYQPWESTFGAGISYEGSEDGFLFTQVLMSDAQFSENQHTPGTPARNGPHILLQQRTGLAAMPDRMRQGTPVIVRGVVGYLTDALGLVVLDWREPDGRLVHMEGVGVSAEEVLKVAEGLDQSH